jgi:hypothetical protein
MKAILREGENIYHSQMHNVPKIRLNSSYQDLQEMSQRDYTPIHNFKNSRPKNAKNHAISLLQMQSSFTTQKKE